MQWYVRRSSLRALWVRWRCARWWPSAAAMTGSSPHRRPRRHDGRQRWRCCRRKHGGCVGDRRFWRRRRGGRGGHGRRGRSGQRRGGHGCVAGMEAERGWAERGWAEREWAERGWAERGGVASGNAAAAVGGGGIGGARGRRWRRGGAGSGGRRNGEAASGTGGGAAASAARGGAGAAAGTGGDSGRRWRERAGGGGAGTAWRGRHGGVGGCQSALDCIPRSGLRRDRPDLRALRRRPQLSGELWRQPHLRERRLRPRNCHVSTDCSDNKICSDPPASPARTTTPAPIRTAPGTSAFRAAASPASAGRPPIARRAGRSAAVRSPAALHHRFAVRVRLRGEPPVRERRLHHRRLPQHRRLRGRPDLRHHRLHLHELRDDTRLRGDFGLNHLCVGGSCISGNCRTGSECTSSEVCGPNTYMCRGCASDTECVSAHGARPPVRKRVVHPRRVPDRSECPNSGLCDLGTHSCGACSTDAACVAGYGMNHLCVNGACVSGMCHTTADCGGGQICDTATFSCVACATDSGCVAAYGPQHLCIANACVVGECRVSSDCSGGKIATRHPALPVVRERHLLQQRPGLRRLDRLPVGRLPPRRLPRQLVGLPDRAALRHLGRQHLRRLLDRRAMQSGSELRPGQHLLSGDLPAR